jgi:hypothetical protein
MGMFDRLKLNPEILPELTPEEKKKLHGCQFQTKSFYRELEEYSIEKDEDGLFLTKNGHTVFNERRMNFYTLDRDRKWYEFNAYLSVAGEITKIERLTSLEL